MKTRIISIVVVALVVLSSATMAQKPMDSKAKPDRKTMMMKKHQAMQKGEYQSFFTEEQKEAMKKLRLETAKQVKPLKNELRELMAHQKTLTTADNANLKDINKNIDKMSDVKAEIAKIMAKQHLEFRSNLTQEQQLKLDSRRNKMRHGHNEIFMKNRMGKCGQHSFRKGV